MPPLRDGFPSDFHHTTAPTATAPFPKSAPSSTLLSRGGYIHTIDEWIAALNHFVREEIRDYVTNTESFLSTLDSVRSTDPTADGHGRNDERNDERNAAESIWEAVGGYDHPQPGSRLLQYGQ